MRAGGGMANTIPSRPTLGARGDAAAGGASRPHRASPAVRPQLPPAQYASAMVASRARVHSAISIQRMNLPAVEAA